MLPRLSFSQPRRKRRTMELTEITKFHNPIAAVHSGLMQQRSAKRKQGEFHTVSAKLHTRGIEPPLIRSRRPQQQACTSEQRIVRHRLPSTNIVFKDAICK